MWDGTIPTAFDDPPELEGIQDGGAMSVFCLNRHSGSMNMVFADTNVRQVGLKELWTLKWHQGYRTDGPWTIVGGVTPEDWPEWMRQFRDY